MLARKILTAAYFCAAVMGYAQFDSGQISGFVRDASQAVISGAMITVVNEGNGEQRQGATNTGGYYVFPNLPVGTYTVTAESAGFKKSAETGIVLNSASKLSIDLTLTVGAVSESLEVKASTSQVQTGNGPSPRGRALVDGGMAGSIMSFRRVVTAAPEACWRHSTDCLNGARGASRYAASNSDSFIHR